MGLTIAGLFGISAILLVVSIIKSVQATKEEKKRIDLAHISVMKEINEIQDSFRNMELDLEIIRNEAGIQLSTSDMLFIREVLDLYKRGYSIESIASKKQVPVRDIMQLLEPYQTQTEERGKVANEI